MRFLWRVEVCLFTSSEVEQRSDRQHEKHDETGDDLIAACPQCRSTSRIIIVVVLSHARSESQRNTSSQILKRRTEEAEELPSSVASLEELLRAYACRLERRLSVEARFSRSVVDEDEQSELAEVTVELLSESERRR